jgi:hypothetical protein
MTLDDLKREVVPKFLSIGSDKFYRILLTSSLNKLVLLGKGEYKGQPPDIELLIGYDQFLILYRREGEDVALDIAKVFRRAAHKIHWIMLKKEMTTKNDKFLRLV